MKKILKENLFVNFFNILQNKQIFKDASIVFMANLFASLILFVTNIFLARFWGAENYGILISLFSITTFAIGFTDFGIGITLVRLVNKYKDEDSERYKFYLQITIIVEIIIGLLLSLIGIYMSKYIGEVIFHTSEYNSLIQISLLTAGLFSCAIYIPAIFQAHSRYKFLAGWTIIPIVLRSIFFFGASIFFHSIELVIKGYFVSVLISIIIGSYIIYRSYKQYIISKFKFNFFFIMEFVNYAKWITISIILGTIATRFDAIILASRSNTTQVGIYSVGSQIAAIGPLLINTFNSILLPRVSKLRTRENFITYLKESLSISIIVCLGLILLMIIGETIIIKLYGIQYSASKNIFYLLLSAFTINILVWPILLLVYAVDRPDILTKVNFLQVIIQVIGNYFLIPYLGALSPAIMYLTITIIGVILIMIWLFNNFIKMNFFKTDWQLRIE